jgi:hypothetical protein
MVTMTDSTSSNRSASRQEGIFMRAIVPYLPLIALTAVLSVVQAAWVASGGTPSTSSVQVTDVALGLFLILWMTGDARRRGCVPCYEFGFLLGVFLPVSLAWYVLWTRGWKGLILLAAFAGLVILPWVAAVLVWLTLPSGH